MGKKDQEYNAWLEKVAKISQRIKDGSEELTPLDDYIKEQECKDKSERKTEERKRQKTTNHKG